MFVVIKFFPSVSSLAKQQQSHLELCVSGIKRYVKKEERDRNWMCDMCEVVLHIAFNIYVEPKVQRKALTVSKVATTFFSCSCESQHQSHKQNFYNTTYCFCFVPVACGA